MEYDGRSLCVPTPQELSLPKEICSMHSVSGAGFACWKVLIGAEHDFEDKRIELAFKLHMVTNRITAGSCRILPSQA